MGVPLQHLVVVLSCVTILLTAAVKGRVGHGGSAVNDKEDDDACGKFESDDDRNRNLVAAMTTLPKFWWRALDVSTENITNVMNTLLGGAAWKGLKNACRMRHF